jgi:hypothetical protein
LDQIGNELWGTIAHDFSSYNFSTGGLRGFGARDRESDAEREVIFKKRKE